MEVHHWCKFDGDARPSGKTDSNVGCAQYDVQAAAGYKKICDHLVCDIKADGYHNLLVAGCSRSGILHYLDQTPSYWFSKHSRNSHLWCWIHLCKSNCLKNHGTPTHVRCATRWGSWLLCDNKIPATNSAKLAISWKVLRYHSVPKANAA